MANWPTSASNVINGVMGFFQDGLPHYNNSKSSVNSFEPLYQNQFEVIITPPSILANTKYGSDLLLEQVQSITGMPEITPAEVVEQKFLWATRSFTKPVPQSTTADLSVVFEVNLSNYNKIKF